MKNFFSVFTKVFLVFILPAVLLGSCQKKTEFAQGEALDKDTSYAFGMIMAYQLNGQGITGLNLNYDAFADGFKALNEAQTTRFSLETAMEKIMPVLSRYQSMAEEELWLAAEKNRELGEAYLAENGARSEVITTSSGLQYEIITQGNGAMPGPSDMVRVQYEGSLIDGSVFDSSYARGVPLEIRPLDVIPGWTEGLQLMNEGSSFRFVIPADLGYGMRSSDPIPPNSTLIFTVELLDVVK